MSHKIVKKEEIKYVYVLIQNRTYYPDEVLGVYLNIDEPKKFISNKYKLDWKEENGNFISERDLFRIIKQQLQ